MQKEVFMAPDGSLPCLPLQYFFGFSGLDLKCVQVSATGGMQKDGFMGRAPGRLL